MPQNQPQTAAERIDEALSRFATSTDPTAMERAEDLVRTLMDFYGSALARFVDLLDETSDGRAELRRVAEDGVVSGLLALHDLHPTPVGDRVARALDRVRPFLGSHAGDVELLGVGDDGVARLRLVGSCDGCPASSITVTTAIERAIEEAAPEIIRVEVDGVVPAVPTGPGGRTLLPVLGAA